MVSTDPKTSREGSEKRVEPAGLCGTHLLVQHVGARHRVQLAGVDELLAHETQLAGGRRLWGGGGTVTRGRKPGPPRLRCPQLYPQSKRSHRRTEVRTQAQRKPSHFPSWGCQPPGPRPARQVRAFVTPPAGPPARLLPDPPGPRPGLQRTGVLHVRTVRGRRLGQKARTWGC